MYFQHPQSKAVLEVANGLSWLWMLLLGPIYLAYKGIWGHVVVYILLIFLLAVTVVGPLFIWVGYAIATQSIIRKHYIHKGWVEIDSTPGKPPNQI